MANLSFNKGRTVRPAEKEKAEEVKGNDKNRAGGKTKKTSGKQQRDDFRDMTRQEDVHKQKETQMIRFKHLNTLIGEIRNECRLF